MAAKFDPKAKAKRQKIIAGVLGLVLVGVLVFQAPTILSAFGGGSSTTASEPAPTPTPVTPPPAPGAPAPGAPAPTAPGASGSALVDSDPAPVAADGQLVAFDQFESKDPFVQQVTEKGPGSSGSGSDPSAPAATPEKGENPEGEPQLEEVPTPSAPEAAPKTATLAVNGSAQRVAVGGTFPEDDPMFKLVSVKRGSAKIGIAGGTYASGSQTVTLRAGGKPVTLMNTADGTTYVIRLLSVA